MKRVAITGCSGFIGSNLARKLIESGYEVHGIVRGASSLSNLDSIQDKMRVHKADINDFEAIGKIVDEVKPDVIHHLAMHNYLDCDSVQDIIKTDISATLNLLHAAKKHGFDLFVNTGSSLEYGRKSQPMKETDVPEPNSPYACAKVAASCWCQHEGRDYNLPVVTLRLFSIYGPYEAKKRFVPQMVLNALEGKDLNLTSSNTYRDFTHVDDVVEAYMHFQRIAKDKKIKCGEIYNVGTGTQATLEQLAREVNGYSGSKSNIKLGAYPDRPWDRTVCWQADISKIMATGWKPKRDLFNGVSSTVEWFKANLKRYE